MPSGWPNVLTPDWSAGEALQTFELSRGLPIFSQTETIEPQCTTEGARHRAMGTRQRAGVSDSKQKPATEEKEQRATGKLCPTALPHRTRLRASGKISGRISGHFAGSLISDNRVGLRLWFRQRPRGARHDLDRQ